MKSVSVDLAVIGAGVAGLSAAQYGARANLSTILIDSLPPGGQLLLVAEIENYPGFPGKTAGFDLAEKMKTQAEDFGARLETHTVESIEKKGARFRIKTSHSEISALAVILATGTKHRHLNIPGEKEFGGKGVSYCATCDGPFFKGKKILVVGGGDAACDEAHFLSRLTDKLIMVHRKDRFRAQKALADRALNNPNIEIRFNTILTEIRGSQMVEGGVLAKPDGSEAYEEAFDAVFVFVGATPQTQLVPQLPQDAGGYIITTQHMETNIPGLFVAGDVRSVAFRQAVVAAGDGALATHSASLYIDRVRENLYPS